MTPQNEVLTVSAESQRELSLKDLFDQLQESPRDVANPKIEIGKMLVVLGAQRPETGTPHAYVQQETGIEVEPASYQAAKAFDLHGEGHGSITEVQFDECALNWLVTMSAIVGPLEKEPDEIRDSIREQVAEAVRSPNAKNWRITQDYQRFAGTRADKGREVGSCGRPALAETISWGTRSTRLLHAAAESEAHDGWRRTRENGGGIQRAYLVLPVRRSGSSCRERRRNRGRGNLNAVGSSSINAAINGSLFFPVFATGISKSNFSQKGPTHE